MESLNWVTDHNDWLKDGQWNPPYMETASDNNFSDTRWQVQGSKLLEPTIMSFQWSLIFLLHKSNNFCVKYGQRHKISEISDPPVF